MAYESVYGFRKDNQIYQQVKRGKRDQHISHKKDQIKNKMFFLYVSDFVGNVLINLIGFKESQQVAGNEDVAEFFDQPHHTGGYHSTSEYRPV